MGPATPQPGQAPPKLPLHVQDQPSPCPETRSLSPRVSRSYRSGRWTPPRPQESHHSIRAPICSPHLSTGHAGVAVTPVKRPTCPRLGGVALLDAWCGSRWCLTTGPAAGWKVRVFRVSGRRQLPVSPAPTPGGASAAWWSLPCAPCPPSPRGPVDLAGVLLAGGPRSLDHPCRTSMWPGPRPFSAGVPRPACQPF